MSTQQDFDECYLNLGLEPGCPWEEVRLTYKKLTQINHPDRFEEGSKEQSQALVKFKLINESFRALSDLFQENGDLREVGVELPPVPGFISEKDLQGVTANTSHSFKSDTTTHYLEAKSKRMGGSSRRTIGNLMLAATVIGVFWFALHKSNEPVVINSEDLERIEKIRLEAEFEAASGKEKDKSLLEEILGVEQDHNAYSKRITFTYGSPMTTVLSAQGAPSLTQGEVWIYGDSRIVFDDKGKVTDWNSHPNNPLNTSLK